MQSASNVPTHVHRSSLGDGNPTDNLQKRFAKRKPDHSSKSCITCNRRKIRCDKENPCANCTKSGTECVFPPPERAPRKMKRPKVTDLMSRLKQLEEEVDRINTDSNIADDSASGMPSDLSVNGVQRPTDTRKGQKVLHALQEHSIPDYLDKQSGKLEISQGRSRYLHQQALVSLGNKIKELNHILEDSSSEDESNDFSSHSLPYSWNQGQFLFGFNSSTHSLQDFHPHEDVARILWNIFDENVAPLVTLLHRPTLKQTIAQAASDLTSLDKKTEALVFSVFFAAITSMTPAQCVSLFGQSQETCVQRYRFAVEQALARAKFLQTRNLTVLQALVLFLICVRRFDDTTFVWAMTALVLRLGQGLGLHRDGSNFELDVFETEMRRRLWWHIYLLDSSSSNEQGMDPQIFELSYDTKLPLNINDDDIYAGIEVLNPREGFTDMTFCLIRFETTIFLHQFKLQSQRDRIAMHKPSLEEQEHTVDELRKSLEEKYFHFCDLNVPLQWAAATIARLALVRASLNIYLSGIGGNLRESGLTPDKLDFLFLMATEVVEFAYLLESNEQTQQWGWFFNTHKQWLAFAFLLSELALRPSDPMTERTWIVVTRVYEKWEQEVSQKRGMLWKPLSQLMARAVLFRRGQTVENRQHATDGPLEMMASMENSSTPAIFDHWQNASLLLQADISNMDPDLSSRELLNEIFSAQGNLKR